MKNPSSEYQNLLALSARVGSDPALVQAAGGNTSIKQDGLMWIKASGTWLMHALESNIMVPVHYPELLAAMHENDPRAETSVDFVQASGNPAGLRPSIETTVHASLPQRVVVHVHCVETLALAVRQDAEAVLSDRLARFRWVFVPYIKPGLTLSRTIMARYTSGADVIVLGNHGLVVAADTVAEADALLSAVCAALQQPVRHVEAPPDPEAATSTLGSPSYQPARSPRTQAMACDPIALSYIVRGSLYPDHVIFLGPGVVVASDAAALADATHRRQAAGLPEPAMVVVPDQGVLLHESAQAGQEALAQCLADVMSRVPEHVELNFLTDVEDAELLNWDAEKYRQRLNQATNDASPSSPSEPS